MTEVIERPELTFDMFRTDSTGIRLVVKEVQRFFGRENYDEFKAAGKNGEYLSEETRQRVDNQVYGKVGKMFNLGWGGGLWHTAIELSNDTVNYARGILFADQERQATLTTAIAWDDGRPSSALERLTMPTGQIGEQCKYEQGRQLGLALFSAEVILRNENGNSRTILTRIDRFLEDKLFIGRRGDPQRYHTFSYHTPSTNRLVGLSSDFPDPSFDEELWVKSLDYPVRRLGVRDLQGEVVEVAQALYDPRDKDLASAVIKAKQRSLKAAKSYPKGIIIETTPYAGDQLGFRLVIMQGRYPLRDSLTANLENLFREFEGFSSIEEDDEVDPNNGPTDRLKFRRRQLFIERLKNPIEVIIQTLPDYISQLYEVGEFNPELGMHAGPAHDLYRLRKVADIAEYLWPFKIYKIGLEETKKASSYDYAARLRRKQRIHPSPYLEES